MKIKDRTSKIIALLRQEYPHAKIALNFSNPMELLVATVLSAQSTDVTVNKVTPAIFRKYKNVNAYAQADLKELEREIYSTGFYHNKAKNIIAAARLLMAQYNGKIPATMDEILELPGVARKTGNIILFNAYGVVAGIPVDTHVRRLSQRLGLTKKNDPEKIEQDLMKLVPQKLWGKFSYLLIDHGRKICDAKKPKCPACVLNKLCPSYRVFYPI
ncbi:MAG: endonuclease III [bacterium]|nr:endonuclease III [bacterium]MDD5756403.1 endonuclease III [bacterium]